MSETWSATLLDCGASKAVCGNEWFNQYVNNLCEEDQQQIQYSESNHMYWFGDGMKVKATCSVKTPALLGDNNIRIQTNVIENDIPLLLSKIIYKVSRNDSRFSEW